MVSAAPRQRAVHPRPQPAEPAAWLALVAHPLATTEAVGTLDDLQPLRGIIGEAAVVGLADGTHGTHEYFTTKLRIIQFLVTQMGFDTLALEGTFSQIARVDAYVRGEPVDLRSAIFPRPGETDYHFWAVEEFLAVADWMRAYNGSRGDRPPLSIVGIDVYDGVPAGASVVEFLQTVDPAAAAAASEAYECLGSSHSDLCIDRVSAVERQIASRQSEYAALSSQRAFDDALHAATVAVQSLSALDPASRNGGMASNTEWARDHRSATGKLIVWGHGEHFGKEIGVEGVATAGMWLQSIFGPDYVAIDNAMWDGSYLGLSASVATAPEMVIHVVPPDPDGYETFLHDGPPAFLLWLGGPLHPFLAMPHFLRTAGFSAGNNWDFRVDLRKKFDALLYVEFTTPTHPVL